MSLALLLSASLFAADAAPVLIMTVPRDNASKRAAQYMSYGFRGAVRRDERFIVSHLGPLYNDHAVDQNKLSRDAEAMVTEGLKYYDDLETDKAQQKFEQALGLFEQNLGEFDSTKAAARIALLAAAAAINNGADKQGRTLMQRALLYDLNVSPDPRVYNSNMMATFKDVRVRAGKGQKGSLAVASNPAYAELYIDGEFIGMTPDKINSIDDGPHLVRVVRDGYRLLSQVVEVRGGRNETAVTLNLIGMPEIRQREVDLDRAAGEVREKAPSGAEELIRRGASTLGVLCAVSTNGDQVKAEVALLNAKGRPVAFAERTFSASSETYREEAERLWGELLSKAGTNLLSPTGTLSEEVTARPEERLQGMSKTKSIVTWSLIGVGAGSVVIGGILGVLAFTQADRFKHTFVQVDPRVADEQASIRTKAILTDVMITVGAAAATAGVLCLFLWKERAPTQSITSLEPPPLALDFGIGPTGVAVGMRGRF